MKDKLARKKHHVILNDELVEHDLMEGDQVCLNYRPSDTGTVSEVIEHGLFINIDWDEHCKNRLGRCWLPNDVERILTQSQYDRKNK